MTPLPAPGSPDAPKYWRDETTGALAAAIRTFRENPEAMSVREIAYVRAYLRQWIDSPVWDANPHATEASRANLRTLRAWAARLASAKGIAGWLELARAEGLDPLCSTGGAAS